jgi:PPOX class probable F420-dependent enzyme
MELSTALDLARGSSHGTLVTLRRDGRPQLSNIVYAVDGDGVIRISVTADRAKYVNLTRNPWAALHVTSGDFFSWYVVLEGESEVSPVATDSDDATASELVALYRSIAGEHPNWDEYRSAMVADRRAVIRIRPTRAYGMQR